jgi:PadR family transcriptional regulator PadR
MRTGCHGCVNDPFILFVLTDEQRASVTRMPPSKSKLELLQGTLDLLILKTLALGPMHGWGISQRIQDMSADVLRVNQGSLYPALHRLEAAGWIDAEWGASENNRQAKFYRLTKSGLRQLRDETAQWELMAGAVARILRAESI